MPQNVEVRDGVALGVDHRAVDVAARSALGVREGRHHLEGVVGAFGAQGHQVLGLAGELGVGPGGAVAVVLLHPCDQAAFRQVQGLGQLIEAVCLHDGAVGHAFLVVPHRVDGALEGGLVEHAVGRQRVGCVDQRAVEVDKPVARQRSLVVKAGTVGAHDDGRVVGAEVVVVADHAAVAGEHEAGGAPGLGVQAVQVGSRGVAHVPELGANLGSQVDAVARVCHAALGVGVGKLQVVLDHLLVVLETARADDHAVEGAHPPALAGDLHLDTVHDLGLGILDQVLGRGLVPDVDGVVLIHELLLEVVQGAVPAGAVEAVVVHEVPAHQVLELAHRVQHQAGGPAVGLDPLGRLDTAVYIGLQEGATAPPRIPAAAVPAAAATPVIKARRLETNDPCALDMVHPFARPGTGRRMCCCAEMGGAHP